MSNLFYRIKFFIAAFKINDILKTVIERSAPQDENLNDAV